MTEPDPGRPTPYPRTISFTGVFNFRDLGGYRGLGGRQVRWRRLFRADSPALLEPADLATFRSLGLRTVLDLRDPGEVERYARVPDEAGCAYVNIPAHPGLGWEAYRPGSDVARFLAERYRRMADEGGDRIGAALRVLAGPAELPLVMHCQVGRDRTGVLAALTLALLGVDHQQVAKDYALSAEGELRYEAWRRAAHPDRPAPAAHLVASPVEAMLIFLQELGERYGGVEEYAAAVGLDEAGVARLRERLLEDGDPAGADNPRPR